MQCTVCVYTQHSAVQYSSNPAQLAWLEKIIAVLSFSHVNHVISSDFQICTIIHVTKKIFSQAIIK